MEDSSGYAICTNARRDSSLEEFVLHVPVLAPWLHRGNTAMLGIRKLSRISYGCGRPLFVFDPNSLLTFKFLFRGWQNLTHQTETVIFPIGWTERWKQAVIVFKTVHRSTTVPILATILFNLYPVKVPYKTSTARQASDAPCDCTAAAAAARGGTHSAAPGSTALW